MITNKGSNMANCETNWFEKNNNLWQNNLWKKFDRQKPTATTEEQTPDLGQSNREWSRVQHPAYDFI